LWGEKLRTIRNRTASDRVSRLTCQGDLPFARLSLSQQLLRAAQFWCPATQERRCAAVERRCAGQPPRVLVVPRGEPVIGGYSLRLSDIWGPAKMPPAPKDFGPHFDFPPAPLNSVRCLILSSLSTSISGKRA
jgi:hypothetical protein